ncbi:MAG: flagellar biosynthesis protein FliQ [Paracoccaceae bacterium]|jgi:flagellar biosynthetic protein FliQ|tara:strand:+ start:68 stop:334 length:267 start_codon:yes stop_codon:yes gene_type:complete
MDFDSNISLLTYAFWQILLVAGPILLVALIVGLAIGILQAATSINEMTLSFVPKVVIVYIALALLASYIMIRLSDYFQFVFEQIRTIS